MFSLFAQCRTPEINIAFISVGCPRGPPSQKLVQLRGRKAEICRMLTLLRWVCMSSPEHHQNSLASGMDAKHVLELRACILIQAEHEPDTCSIFCLLLAHIFAEAMLPDHPRKRKADDRNASPQMPTRKVFRGSRWRNAASPRRPNRAVKFPGTSRSPHRPHLQPVLGLRRLC